MRTLLRISAVVLLVWAYTTWDLTTEGYGTETAIWLAAVYLVAGVILLVVGTFVYFFLSAHIKGRRIAQRDIARWRAEGLWVLPHKAWGLYLGATIRNAPPDQPGTEVEVYWVGTEGDIGIRRIAYRA